MRNSIAHGRRVVLRMVILQLGGATLVAAVVLLLTGGGRAAVAALAGGAVSAVAWVVSGTRALSGSPAGGGVVLARLVGAILLRWSIVCGGLWIAMMQWRLPPLALIGGFGAALVASALAWVWDFEDRASE